MIHSFLLIGQSNAAGRGFLEGAPPPDACDGRIKILRNGLWIKLFRPVNPDRRMSGVCLAESFALAYASVHPEVEVGIIPCADGGTTISQWQPEQTLFENAVHCAKMAMRTSELQGILWHQGESDCTVEKISRYPRRFWTMAAALRTALGRPDLPILVGGLGDFLADYAGEGIPENYRRVNAVLSHIGQTCPRTAFVSATGLASNPDNLHFSAEALLEFGRRYFDAWQPFDGGAVTDAESVAIERSAIELL